MTEKDIERLIAEVGDSDPSIEREVLEESIPEFKKNLSKLQAIFRLHKHLRDDERMTTAATDVKKTKQALEYMEARLIELAGARIHGSTVDRTRGRSPVRHQYVSNKKPDPIQDL